MASESNMEVPREEAAASQAASSQRTSAKAARNKRKREVQKMKKVAERSGLLAEEEALKAALEANEAELARFDLLDDEDAETAATDQKLNDHEVLESAKARPFEVMSTEKKGFGLFATEFIPKDTCILKEGFLMKSSTTHLAQEACFASLSVANKVKYLALHALCVCGATSCPEPMVNRIFNSNSISLPPPRVSASSQESQPTLFATYETASRLNHSCIPNVGYGFTKKTTDIYVYALQDIEKGAELTISYDTKCVGLPMTRRLYLNKHTGFWCECWACDQKRATDAATLRPHNRVQSMVNAIVRGSPESKVVRSLCAAERDIWKSAEKWGADARDDLDLRLRTSRSKIVLISLMCVTNTLVSDVDKGKETQIMLDGHRDYLKRTDEFGMSDLAIEAYLERRRPRCQSLLMQLARELVGPGAAEAMAAPSPRV
ncbi:MAG: hypothetical protein M1818_006444 [Claussenomyces sp. TS43310]|nr:MAG: hypothetical protein M1818_006444 [Claussenomyces sp. TS43310]